ncbi:MAG TPA: SpoIIE family protein phosphatase [Actinomycetota bacterium]|nr:SpoIIE family protein phosphatase [Actinomycetota bacterium]
MNGSLSPTRRGVILAFSYWLAAVVSLRVALVENVVTPIWPPSGIALVCLLFWGRKLWPWVTAAAFAVNLARTPTPLAALGLAAGNTLAPLLAATLLKRVKFDPQFRQKSDALALVFLGALASMTVSASIGTGVLYASDVIDRSEVAGTWSVWWAGDALGVLVFAPLILSFRTKDRPALTAPLRKLEVACLSAALVLTAGQVFRADLPIRYLLFPLLAWAALRFGIIGAAMATLVVTGFAVAASVAGTDPLVGGSLSERMLSLQLLNATAALTSFVLAASWSIRHRAAEVLKDQAQKLEAAVQERTAALTSAKDALETEVAIRSQSQAFLAERERLLNEAESLAHVGSWSWDIVKDEITWSDELFRIYGLEKQDAKLAYRKYLELQHPEDREVLKEKVAEAMQNGTPYDVDHRIVRPDGEMRWIRGRAKAVMGPSGAVRLYGAAQDITEQKLAEDRLRESEERYRGLVEQAPEAIFVMDLDTGTFVEVNRAAEELLGRPRTELFGTRVREIVAPVQPDGRTVSELADGLLEQILAGEAPLLEWLLLHASGREILCEIRTFYLPSAGKRLARASVVDITERRRIETALRQAEDERRQLHEQQHIAQTLQRSLLPTGLPDVPGVGLAVRYLPGSEGLEVGGDFYDAFALPGGSLGLVVGDIVGRGLKAAAMMGQLRTALRAYALQNPSPAVVLRRISELVDNFLDAEMATLVYAVFDRDTGVLTYSSAGHPPPLIVAPNGEASFLAGGRSAPLGIPDLTFAEATEALQPGTIVLFYTDGLVERRTSPIDEGLDKLAAAASDAVRSTGDLEELTSKILASMNSGETLQDDTALLTMAVGPVRTDDFTFRGPAEPESLLHLRRLFSRWLANRGASQDEQQDLVLAVTEAAANSVLHAYGAGEGTFEVEAGKEASVVSVGVKDHGSWRIQRARIGGRGLKLIRALVSSISIDSDSSGTRVKMQRVLGQPLPEHQPAGPAEFGEFGDSWPDENAVAVVRPPDELDISNSQEVAAHLLKQLGNDKIGLVLDLSHVQFLDSSAIGMLLQLNRRLEARRLQLRLVAPEGSAAAQVLSVAEVDGVLPIAATVAQAVESIVDGEAF